MARSLWVRDRGIVTCGRGLVYGESAPACACGETPGACCIAGVCSQQTMAACLGNGGQFVGGECLPNSCAPPPLPCCTAPPGRMCFLGGSPNQPLSISGSIDLVWTNVASCDGGGTVTFTHSKSVVIPATFANVGGSCAVRSVSALAFAFEVVQGCINPAGRCYRFGLSLTHNGVAGGNRWAFSAEGAFVSTSTDFGLSGCQNLPPSSYSSSTSRVVIPTTGAGGSCAGSSGFGASLTIPEGGPRFRRLVATNGTAIAQLGYECSGQANRVLVPGIDFKGSSVGAAVASLGCSGCGKGLGERAF